MTFCATVLLYVSSLFAAGRTQRVAPGDEDQICATIYESGSGSGLGSGGSGELIWPDVDPNQEILMSSYNYANLLETNGGPWISVVQNDDDEPSVSSCSCSHMQPRSLSLT